MDSHLFRKIKMSSCACAIDMVFSCFSSPLLSVQLNESRFWDLVHWQWCIWLLWMDYHRQQFQGMLFLSSACHAKLSFECPGWLPIVGRYKYLHQKSICSFFSLSYSSRPCSSATLEQGLKRQPIYTAVRHDEWLDATKGALCTKS